jgi:hypothetical protein
LGYGKIEGHEKYRLIDKLQQKIIFCSNVVFNEPALIPIGEGGGNENGPTNDTLAGKDEGFMPFNNKMKNQLSYLTCYQLYYFPHCQLMTPPWESQKFHLHFY